MDAKQTGGPAFPCDVFDPQVTGPEQHEGMTLRDYFAIHLADEPGDNDYGDEVKALLVGRACPSGRADGWLTVMEFEAEFRAKWRLFRADAMLKAREA